MAGSAPPLAASGSGDRVIQGYGPGVLEIKCPFNKGDPNSAAPPKLAQWYYMPQVLLPALLNHAHISRPLRHAAPETDMHSHYIRHACIHVDTYE